MGLSLDRFTARSVYRPWRRPRSFDRNLVVIGGGAAGLVTSYIAAAVKASVSLVEKHRMGGDCLYTGCVPSKTLLRSAKFQHDVDRARDLGFSHAEARFDFAELMARVRRVIAAIEPHDSPERYESLGVNCVAGEARLTSPWEVAIGDEVLTARAIVLATGGSPVVPPIPGLAGAPFVTSDSLWDLTEQPRRLLVLGGGPIGCELAQAFTRLGSEVTVVEMAERILNREDEDVSSLIASTMTAEGTRILTGHRATAFGQDGGGWSCTCEGPAGPVALPFDQVLVAVGRQANTANLGLEALGIETGRGGTVNVNPYLQTKFPNILACGDVIGPWQFTHSAAHEAWYAAVNALFGDLYKMKVDYSHMPRATYVDPEVAGVGLTEAEARDQGIAYEVTSHPLDGLDRALADQEAKGFVKVLTPPGKDSILGVTIVGPSAGELLAEFNLARRHGLGLGRILGTIHSYPTLAEANKFVAGNWRRNHQPERLLALLTRLHRWRR